MWLLGERAGNTNRDINSAPPLSGPWNGLPPTSRISEASFLRLSLELFARPLTLEVNERLLDLSPDGRGLPTILRRMKIAAELQFARVNERAPEGVDVVGGVPTTEIETWLLIAFEPADDYERLALAKSTPNTGDMSMSALVASGARR